MEIRKNFFPAFSAEKSTNEPFFEVLFWVWKKKFRSFFLGFLKKHNLKAKKGWKRNLLASCANLECCPSEGSARTWQPGNSGKYQLDENPSSWLAMVNFNPHLPPEGSLDPFVRFLWGKFGSPWGLNFLIEVMFFFSEYCLVYFNFLKKLRVIQLPAVTHLECGVELLSWQKTNRQPTGSASCQTLFNNFCTPKNGCGCLRIHFGWRLSVCHKLSFPGSCASRKGFWISAGSGWQANNSVIISLWFFFPQKSQRFRLRCVSLGTEWWPSWSTNGTSLNGMLSAVEGKYRFSSASNWIESDLADEVWGFAMNQACQKVRRNQEQSGCIVERENLRNYHVRFFFVLMIENEILRKKSS